MYYYYYYYYYYWILQTFGAKAFEIQPGSPLRNESDFIAWASDTSRILSLSEPLTLGVLKLMGRPVGSGGVRRHPMVGWAWGLYGPYSSMSPIRYSDVPNRNSELYSRISLYN